MTIEIREVTTKKELKQFIQFGIDLFKGNPYYCPPLVFDEINTFDTTKNPAHEICDHIIYMAYKDGKIVGRIVGIINYKANERWENKRLRFGWIDFIDNLAVSQALLEAVQAWGKTHGMTEMNGPVGFTDFDHQGLLIEGFEYNSPMASLYNYPYYEKHLEAFGLQKEIDWIEYRLTIADEAPPRMQRLAQIVMEKSKLKIHSIKSIKELKKYYPNNEYLDVIDQAYQKLYNYQPLTEKQKTYYSNMYFPLLNFDFITIVINEMNEIVGVGLGMPDISDALRKCKGRLFPFGWFHILKALKAKKNMMYFDMLLMAVRPDYQNKGINAIFFYNTSKYFKQYGVKYAETTSILETNNKSQANFDEYEKIQHKRRRAYLKPIA
ncbi:MAG: N-acetyltransferase [Paludibacteraceae bacterium]|nr:N-acetyltransferase [Paludibacteraceae bacterium]